ncbi:MAG: thioredoxin [Actinomycetota bacterium]|nr:thioredoxin [Actinomycetota bacterium]
MSSTRVIVCTSCGTKNRVPDAAAGVPRCGRCHEPLPWIVDAGAATFDEIAATSALPIVVDLWAPWCGPCRTVSPLLEQLAVELAGRVRLVKVNVDEAPAVQSRFRVQGIPTFVLLRKGTEISRLIGAHPIGGLRDWIEQGLRAAA